jgi:adenine-specific DNA methylase
MSRESGRSAERRERTELPIERGFPIERVNEIAEKESRAKPYYRPIYTMHKWWARRLGCVFRSICLYTLLDDSEKVSVRETGENGTLSDFGGGHTEVQELIEKVDMEDPESLWDFYTKDVQIEDKKILDPFMGGGTSLVEASRFGVEAKGRDLNPVAWFVTKKEIEAGQSDIAELNEAYEMVKSNLSEELRSHYKTNCSNDDHKAEAVYHFWVKELDCVSCGNNVPLFKDYRVSKGRYENDDKYHIVCPECGDLFLVQDWKDECECNCGHEFVPSNGNVSRGGNYSCSECGAKYSITDAVQETEGYSHRLYAVEFYCETCDEMGLEKSQHKGYKAAEEYDLERFESAKNEWRDSEDLHNYVPDEKIPEGHLPSERNPLFDHGYSNWTDLFNSRQLLCLSKLLREIDDIDNQNAKEFLLMAFSDSLMFQSTFSIYNQQRNNMEGVFRMNSYVPQSDYVENNVWGAEFGRGNFSNTWEKLLRGVKYAKHPTERYLDNGETQETPEFSTPIGGNIDVELGDMRTLEDTDEYDAVITDPPYYDNIIYSEVADYFYVWQKLLLEEEYDGFEAEKTPRSESIVVNPFLGKTSEDFETELHEAFSVIHNSLKDDGVLTFTYHHSGAESWGELLEALCEVGFEVTATYPISSDTSKFITGEAVEFDIVIVARPAGERRPISWNSLRRQIYRTAQKTHQRLEKSRNISQGDIGVIEMGECFHEYSKHHGKVMRAGDEMTAKEIVQEIYGVIQQGSEIGEIDVFLDLLETPDPTYNDLNKLTRGTDANPDQMEDMRLYRMEGNDFILGTWDDEKRMAYIQGRVNGDDEALNALDKAQFLRYRYERGKSTQNYLSKWDVDDDLRELCEGLADATGDDTYRRILGADSTLGEF